MAQPFNLFIFDWSGTISDDRRPVYEANQRMSAHWGIPPISYETWLPKTAMTVFDYFRDAGVTATDQEIWDLYTRTFNEINTENQLPTVYADARRALESLRTPDRTLTILSAHPQRNLTEEAERYGLAGLFDIISGDSRDKSEGIRFFLETLETPPDRAVYIGDTVNDMRHAHAAGIRRAAITTGYHSRPALEAERPDFIFDSLTELAEYFS